MDLPDGYRISQDQAELQLSVIHSYLSRSYGSQAGFARIATDARPLMQILRKDIYEG